MSSYSHLIISVSSTQPTIHHFLVKSITHSVNKLCISPLVHSSAFSNNSHKILDSFSVNAFSQLLHNHFVNQTLSSHDNFLIASAIYVLNFVHQSILAAIVAHQYFSIHHKSHSCKYQTIAAGIVNHHSHSLIDSDRDFFQIHSAAFDATTISLFNDFMSHSHKSSDVFSINVLTLSLSFAIQSAVSVSLGSHTLFNL
jgi:hypothetical protein